MWPWSLTFSANLKLPLDYEVGTIPVVCMYYALCVHECVLVAIGTIPILRQYSFGLFQTHPPSIVSMNTALVSIFPNQPFTSPLICWRNGSSTEFRLTSFDRVTMSWGPGNHSMSPPECRPPFLKPKLHKESKNGFKQINFRSPL